MSPSALPPAVILVVDDEPAVNQLVTRYLKHLGYRTLHASSGEEALAVMRRAWPRINLVLSDIVLPGMSGTHLAQTVLAHCPGPSVILMTGILPEEVERVPIDGQIVRVLHKPLDLDELRQLLQVMLEGFPAEDGGETGEDSLQLNRAGEREAAI